MDRQTGEIVKGEEGLRYLAEKAARRRGNRRKGSAVIRGREQVVIPIDPQFLAHVGAASGSRSAVC